jgi:hypothetical protein
MREFIATARLLWRDKRSLGVIYAAFLLFLLAATGFVLVREATIFQVVITFVLPFVIALLFFFLQALCVGYEAGKPLPAWLRRAARLTLDIAGVTMPVFFIFVCLAYLSGRLQTVWVALAGGAVLPLLAIHLWLEADKKGVLRAWRNGFNVLRNAFAPPSLAAYLVGLLVFAGGPFLLTQARLPLPGRAQVFWFVMRLITAGMVALFGWAATILTLKHIRDNN